MNLLGRVRFLLKARWIFKKPRKAPVVIFDRESLVLFSLFFHEKDYVVLDVRGETINFFILIVSIVSKIFKNNLSLEDIYRETFIEKVQPKIVITLIDNNISFYRLCNKKNGYIKIFIQNACRGGMDDIFIDLKHATREHKYFVDYMFVFNAPIGNEYLKYLSGEVIRIGSLKNNIADKKKSLEFKSTILFISQFAFIAAFDEKGTVGFNPSGKAFSWDEFYAAEALFLPWLAKFVKKNGLNLQICLRYSDSSNSSKEKQYFRDLLGDIDIEFLPKKGLYSSFEYLDNAEYIVGIDSTLGYEALARGCRIGIFALRSVFLAYPDHKFGWPADLSDTGLFWTNALDQAEFQRVMEYITSVSNEDWQDVSKKYSKMVMEYDPGNTKFLSLMEQLDVPLRAYNERVAV